MKLESITLHNFQAHTNCTVQFAPGLTTIKGPTDAGKSAVLRALRWVCLNDPAGADFIQEGAKRVSVELHVTDGKGSHAAIVRTKSKDGHVNTYALDGEEFKAFGLGGVPPDIANGLALSEINFQGQHDAPFWFAETPGEVSRKLNSVIDLSIIDTTLAAIASEVRRAQERKSLTEERLKEAQAQLEKLDPQRERVAKFATLKEQHGRFNKVTNDHSKLEDFLGRIRANKAPALAAQAEDGVALLAAMLAARRAQRTHEVLQGLVSGITQLATVQHPPDFLPVTQAWRNYGEALLRVDSLSQLLESAAKKQARVKALEESAQQAETQFHQQLRGKACPLCGQIMLAQGQLKI